MRTSLLLLCLVSTVALADEGATVRIHCPEGCSVKLDGRAGLRINDSTWEYKGIAPGRRRVEATGMLSRHLASSFADIPAVSEADIYIDGKGRVGVSIPKNATPSKSADSGGAKASPAADAGKKEEKSAAAPAGGKGKLIVRCTESCTARLEGRTGRRQGDRIWEFEDVEPGSRRVEAQGGFLNSIRYGGYVDVPAGQQLSVLVDNKGRLTVLETKPLTAAAPEQKPQASAGASSTLNVRCQKGCTVKVDRVRRGASSAQNVIIPDVTPGSHDVEVEFVLGTKVRRGTLDIPAGSEVFVFASEESLQITNTRPLGK